MAMIPPGRGRAALSIGACFAVAGAMTYFITRDGDMPAPTPAPVVPMLATTVGTPEAKETAAPDPTADPDAPSVDVMRVEAGGSTVVAGTARPGARVSVLAGDRQLAEVNADEAGRFVAMFEAGTSTEPRALTLEARSENGDVTKSEQVMVLLPSDAPEVKPPEAPAPDAAAPEAAPTTPVIGAAAILTPRSATVTPLAPRPGAAEGQVAFASISYGEGGAMTLDGFGAPGAALRVYLDGAFARTGRVGEDGRWRVEVPEAPFGTYTLRVDQVDAAGKVVSRTETPFRRDAETAGSEPGEASIVVQPGNSLWTLARIHYGTGVRYTQILDANAKLIADPDLIYPGQIFRVPETEE
jgi:nucleoid-associated protein YgaU